VQLTEDEYQNDILMIGGISIFLPFAPEEAENYIADAAISEEHSTVTVKQKLEQMVGTSQEDQENERSEERLNDFSQEAEEVVALELTAEEDAEEELEQTLKSAHA
jgi:hypothetical protein